MTSNFYGHIFRYRCTWSGPQFFSRLRQVSAGTTHNKLQQPEIHVQYRHSFPAPVARTSASACLYKHSWITSQRISKHINDTRSLRINATLSCEVIHVPGNGWHLGIRSCIMPGRPTHLVSELYVGTVCTEASSFLRTGSVYGFSNFEC